MSMARKCERCERCFDPRTADGVMCRFRNPFFQTREDVKAQMVGRTMLDDANDAWVDLCPECAEMFEAFMCGAEPPPAPKIRREERTYNNEVSGKAHMEFWAALADLAELVNTEEEKDE